MHRRSGPRTWVTLLSQGHAPIVKLGSAAPSEDRMQRALNAADRAGLTVTGVFDSATTSAVRRYQHDHPRLSRTGVANGRVWVRVQSGLL